MNEEVIVFIRGAGPDGGNGWHNEAHNAGLCSSGLEEYVSVPREVDEFQAVFTEDHPNVDCFELTGGGSLDIDGDPDFYEGATDLIRTMYDRGFAYLNVRY